MRPCCGPSGEWHAINSRWKQAADRFALLLQVDQLDGVDVATLDYLRLGPALIELHDTTATSASARRRSPVSSRPRGPFADRIVKISLLLPADKPLIESLASGRRGHGEVARRGGRQTATGFKAAWRSVSRWLCTSTAGAISPRRSNGASGAWPTRNPTRRGRRRPA